MKLRQGDQVHEIDVRAAGETFEITVDGQRRGVRVEEITRGRFVLYEEARQETFHCVRDGAIIHLFWRGSVYTLLEEREGARPALRGGDRLDAPMPGRVTAVRVEPGQPVKKGQELLVVEAMKMENALRAPRDGTVKAVLAKPGDMVSPGVVLVELE